MPSYCNEAEGADHASGTHKSPSSFPGAKEMVLFLSSIESIIQEIHMEAEDGKDEWYGSTSCVDFRGT